MLHPSVRHAAKAKGEREPAARAPPFVYVRPGRRGRQKTRAYCSLPTKPSLPTPLRFTTAITLSTTR